MTKIQIYARNVRESSSYLNIFECHISKRLKEIYPNSKVTAGYSMININDEFYNIKGYGDLRFYGNINKCKDQSIHDDDVIDEIEVIDELPVTI